MHDGPIINAELGLVAVRHAFLCHSFSIQALPVVPTSLARAVSCLSALIFDFFQRLFQQRSATMRGHVTGQACFLSHFHPSLSRSQVGCRCTSPWTVVLEITLKACVQHSSLMCFAPKCVCLR